MSSSRVRGHLRQLVRMHWLAACVATVQRLHGTSPRFWSRSWPVTEREHFFAHFNLYVALAALMAGYGVRLSEMHDSYFGPVQRRHDGPDRAAALPNQHTKKGRGR